MISARKLMHSQMHQNVRYLIAIKKIMLLKILTYCHKTTAWCRNKKLLNCQSQF